MTLLVSRLPGPLVPLDGFDWLLPGQIVVYSPIFRGFFRVNRSPPHGGFAKPVISGFVAPADSEH